MSRIQIEQVNHTYDGAVYALEDVDITFEDGRTYALLGPSGCGKTTMLNIISGLVRPTAGRVRLDDRDVTDVPTVGRNIAQVFQFPVVYQTKTVYSNLAFPLECRNWDRARIRSRVGEIADLLGLADRLHQPARRLTADEKQLVSLGRGLVRDDVAGLLMDEPLTVIDPQLKAELRVRIKQANEKTRNTVIYVTHDQNEAMTFADEVLVMRSGRVVQAGSAEDLFEYPRDTYVGTFIGSPGMNFLKAERKRKQVVVGGVAIPFDVPLDELSTTGDIMIGIRPEHLSFSESAELAVPVKVVDAEDHGTFRVLDIEIGTEHAKMKITRDTPIPHDQTWVTCSPQKIRLYRDGELVS